MNVAAVNLVGFIVFFMFALSFLISALFAFSFDTYHEIDAFLTRAIIPARVLIALEQPILFVDEWLDHHHRPTGVILLVLSGFNMLVTLYVMRILSTMLA